jgi:hypothetical protein
MAIELEALFDGAGLIGVHQDTMALEPPAVAIHRRAWATR